MLFSDIQTVHVGPFSGSNDEFPGTETSEQYLDVEKEKHK